MFSHIQALRENQRQAGVAVVDHARDCSPHATAFLNFFTLVINKTATGKYPWQTRTNQPSKTNKPTKIKQDIQS